MKTSVKLRKLSTWIISLTFIVIIVSWLVASAQNELAKPTLIEFDTSSKTGTYASYLSLYNGYNNDDNYTYGVDDFTLEANEAISVGDYYDWYNEKTVTLPLNVSEAGLYSVVLTFQSDESNYEPIVIDLKIDGQTPFDEATQMTVDHYWVEQDEEVTQDRYGNDVSVIKESYNTYVSIPLKDAGRVYTSGLHIFLDDTHQALTLTNVSGSLKLRKIVLVSAVELIDYNTYLNSQTATNETLTKIEAEDMFYMNHSSITRGTSRDIGVTPFSVSKLKLNVIGVENYNQPGDAVSWQVDVDEPGYYHITIKGLQTRQKTTSYRTLRINGEIPFDDAQHIHFPYFNSWHNYTLSNLDNEPYLFYLKKDDVITLEVDASLFIGISTALREVSSDITQFGLEVTKLTRNNVDKNIDWDMIAYFPDIYTRIDAWQIKLNEIITALYDLYGYQSDAKVISDLKAALQKINTIEKDIDEIPRRLTLLSVGSTSASTLISAQIDVVLQQPLVMDAIYIHAQTEAPKANADFFESFFIQIERFVASFIDPSYTESVQPDEIEVWVNRSRQYVDLIQRLTDGVFTEQTGIKVKVSLMNDDGKLLLANSADKQPDVAMGISAWIPNDYGMRGMLQDLTELEGFEDVLSVYNPEQIVPMIYDNKLYGLPETENFYVLAYRKDILNELELTVPNTWDDVLDMLPVLERYGMSFYVPLSNSSALKSFDTTAPFIYQFGGKLYADDGLSAAIDDENTLEAMTFMADLFREYSLSYQVPSFFNSFRDGRIPIGIADFGMYLQLLNAASEIKGLWDIALVPGVDDGQTINRFMPGAQQATVIFKKSEKVDRAWAFLKWWHSTETQILFSNTLVNTLGTRYLWNTANMEAFEALNWNSNHKDIILEQWTHLKEVPKIPGSYMVEREISNTLNSVVFFDANLRSTITDSILKMNKEIDRKMLEFGYIDQQGNPVKPFIIPSRSIVEGWANDND